MASRAFSYPRPRRFAAHAQDILLAVVLAVALASGLRGGFAVALASSAAAALLWGVLSLHFPTRVTVDDEALVFHGYGRSHRFARRDVAAVLVRRFLVRDRVLLRVVERRGTRPWRGRYWVLDSIEGFDELVAALPSWRSSEAE